MGNTIVRMEMSSISTSLLVHGLISNQRLWTSIHKNSSATISSLTRESRFCVRDVMTSLYLRFKLVQGLQCMRTHSCQTTVWRQRAARSSITFSDRRLWDSAAHCFLTAACGMRMRNHKRCWGQQLLPQSRSRKGCVCTSACIKMNVSCLSPVCHTTKTWTSIAIARLQHCLSLVSERKGLSAFTVTVTVWRFYQCSREKSSPIMLIVLISISRHECHVY